MAFNSLIFALFLPIVFVVYWLLQRHLRLQNAFVVLASYVFYGWWDWRFLGLIAFTSVLTWGTGWLIADAKRTKGDKGGKGWLIATIAINLAILCVFKYYDFFVSSFCALFHIDATTHLLNLVLPVGISFYTFQAISYSVDVYRKDLNPTTNLITFCAYLTFFPQLVAGPIERATNLLPQFDKARSFDYTNAVEGLRRILWGLFKKVVIADTCATFVDPVWDHFRDQPASALVLAAILFAFQIYGDFSGYSDIAIGTARLFGIRLRENFRTPYFSRDVAEFWQRWHISLNTWFVDYIYIPLGGSRNGLARTIGNTFVIFLLSGLWHGAEWSFVGWGIYHACLFMVLLLTGRTHRYRDDATGQQWPQIMLTFLLVVTGWILFRAPDIETAWDFLCAMCSNPHLVLPNGLPVARLTGLVACIGLMGVWEWRGRRKDEAPIPHKRIVYYILILAIWWFSGRASTDFIYFQF